MAAAGVEIPEMDRKVRDWLGANLGRVVSFTSHPRWRTGWDAEVECDGVKNRAPYPRTPRGKLYVSRRYAPGSRDPWRI
jgi:hypothetical protein